MTDWIRDLIFDVGTGGSQARPKEEDSPYFGTPEDEWPSITASLLRENPLDGPRLVDAVLESWNDIFESSIGPVHIGKEIFPSPQIMGFLLHELIPIRVAMEADGWRRDASASEKDLVYVPDHNYSIEIKTSSHPNQIFGNRSFGVPGTSRGKKAKSGYYCAVNFERWLDVDGRPEIRSIRYGWIDSTDWVAQASQTGQQSSLPARVYRTQLPILYR